MKKCDVCGKEFNRRGFIIGHIKDKPEIDFIICNECADALYRETLKELLKGESDDLDIN